MGRGVAVGEQGSSRPADKTQDHREGSLCASEGFARAAAVVVGIGGLVLPVLGWIIGIVMMWQSPAWRRVDKVVATVTPLMLAALVAGAVRVTWLVHDRSEEAEGHAVVVSAYDVAWLGCAVLVVLTAALGLWLFRRIASAARISSA